MFVGLLIRVLAFLSLTVGAVLPAADFQLQDGSAAIESAGVDLSLESDLTDLARPRCISFLDTGDATPNVTRISMIHSVPVRRLCCL